MRVVVTGGAGLVGRAVVRILRERGDAVAIAAGIAGRRPPALRMPTALLRRMTPRGPLIGQPNVGELGRASAGASYLLSPARAQAELGFTTRAIEAGFRDTFGAG